MDLVHLRQFGEKALDKLAEIGDPIPNIPSFPIKRVPHERNNEIFTFSYTFSYEEILRSESSSTYGLESPEFLDKTSEVKWKVKVYFQKCSQKPEYRYLNIYLYRNSEGGSQADREDTEFAKELFAQIEKDDNTSDSTVISCCHMNDNTRNYGGGLGSIVFMAISSLQGKHTIAIGVAIYTKPK